MKIRMVGDHLVAPFVNVEALWADGTVQELADEHAESMIRAGHAVEVVEDETNDEQLEGRAVGPDETKVIGPAETKVADPDETKVDEPTSAAPGPSVD